MIHAKPAPIAILATVAQPIFSFIKVAVYPNVLEGIGRIVKQAHAQNVHPSVQTVKATN